MGPQRVQLHPLHPPGYGPALEKSIEQTAIHLVFHIISLHPTADQQPRHVHLTTHARIFQVPTHFMTDAELHGLVCVPASSLGSALAGHQDHTTHHRDGTITTHRTVLAGTDGTTSHSTRITSAGDGTTVETRTNSSSGVQQHLQSVRDTGAGLVRTSTGEGAKSPYCSYYERASAASGASSFEFKGKI